MPCFWGLGAVLGPVIGGAFAVSSATWRWAFYINLAIGAVSAPAFLFCLPAIHPMKAIMLIAALCMKNEKLFGLAIAVGG